MAVNAQGRDTQFTMLPAETCQNTSRRETNLNQQCCCTQETKHFLAFDFFWDGNQRDERMRW